MALHPNQAMNSTSMWAVRSDDPQLLPYNERWLYGILSSVGVSSMGFVLALLVVCLKRSHQQACFKRFISFLYALSCGALIGDAFLHILPDVYKHDGAKQEIVAGILVGSLFFFVILERLLESWGHSHAPGDELQSLISRQEATPVDQIDESDSHNHNHNHNHGSKPGTQNKSRIRSKSRSPSPGILRPFKGKKPSGYLNLLGSLIHNCMDGLGIGLAYSTGNRTQYLPVVLAIVTHQIPREMGDVAILMKANFTDWQTVLCNGTVNLMSVVGTAIGLATGTAMDQLLQEYILVIVSANFIVVAAELWRNLWRRSSWSERILEAFGVTVGYGLLYAVWLYQKLNNADE